MNVKAGMTEVAFGPDGLSLKPKFGKAKSWPIAALGQIAYNPPGLGVIKISVFTAEGEEIKGFPPLRAKEGEQLLSEAHELGVEVVENERNFGAYMATKAAERQAKRYEDKGERFTERYPNRLGFMTAAALWKSQGYVVDGEPEVVEEKNPLNRLATLTFTDTKRTYVVNYVRADLAS